MTEKKSVLMVCLGNICRSPIAEAVFIETLKEKKLQDLWTVDSAALGPWHVGKSAEKRALATLRKHNIEYSNRARQVKDSDFEKFDYIFGMDEDNISELKQIQPKNTKAKILLLGDSDPQGERIIRDPYYDDGSEGFEKCYQQCVRCCRAFLS